MNSQNEKWLALFLSLFGFVMIALLIAMDRGGLFATPGWQSLHLISESLKAGVLLHFFVCFGVICVRRKWVYMIPLVTSICSLGLLSLEFA